MAARKTVKPNMDKLHLYVSESGWSNAAFARKVGKHDRWLSEVARGRNFPSPEEAARMCVLLQTTPEEILSEEADVELVRSLIEQERKKSVKKERPADSEALTDMQKTTIDLVKSMSDADLKLFLDILKTVRENSKRSE